jgi:hypothetical protein
VAQKGSGLQDFLRDASRPRLFFPVVAELAPFLQGGRRRVPQIDRPIVILCTRQRAVGKDLNVNPLGSPCVLCGFLQRLPHFFNRLLRITGYVGHE